MAWQKGSEILFDIRGIVKEAILEENTNSDFDKDSLVFFMKNDIDLDEVDEFDPLLEEVMRGYQTH